LNYYIRRGKRKGGSVTSLEMFAKAKQALNWAYGFEHRDAVWYQASAIQSFVESLKSTECAHGCDYDHYFLSGKEGGDQGSNKGLKMVWRGRPCSGKHQNNTC
jgi:hypothetical protein